MDFENWKEVFLGLLALIVGGVGVAGPRWLRQRSADKAQQAADQASASRSQAEGDYYTDIVDRLTGECSRWQRLADERLERFDAERERHRKEREADQKQFNALLETERKVNKDLETKLITSEADQRHERKNHLQRLKFLQYQHPDWDLRVLDSGPVPLASPPHPATRRTDPDPGPDSNLAKLDGG